MLLLFSRNWLLKEMHKVEWTCAVKSSVLLMLLKSSGSVHILIKSKVI